MSVSSSRPAWASQTGETAASLVAHGPGPQRRAGGHRRHRQESPGQRRVGSVVRRRRPRPCSTIRPWSSWATRSAMERTTSISWVITRIVTPRSSRSSVGRSRIARLLSGSRPEVASSASRTAGSGRAGRAIPPLALAAGELRGWWIWRGAASRRAPAGRRRVADAPVGQAGVAHRQGDVLGGGEAAQQVRQTGTRCRSGGGPGAGRGARAGEVPAVDGDGAAGRPLEVDAAREACSARTARADGQRRCAYRSIPLQPQLPSHPNLLPSQPPTRRRSAGRDAVVHHGTDARTRASLAGRRRVALGRPAKRAEDHPLMAKAVASTSRSARR